MAVPKDCRQTGGPSKAPGGSRAAFRVPAVKKKPEPLGPFTVLTRPQLAAWLKVSERTLDKYAYAIPNHSRDGGRRMGGKAEVSQRRIERPRNVLP